MTAGLRLAHPTLVRGGMAFLHRTCPERHAALAAKAAACALPEEDRAFLAGCGGGDDSGFHLTGI
jgi:hypothetical protein